MNKRFSIGEMVQTNEVYFSRYGQEIFGTVMKIEIDKVWVRNQYDTISIIPMICLQKRETHNAELLI